MEHGVIQSTPPPFYYICRLNVHRSYIQLIPLYQFRLGIIASGIDFVLRPARGRSVSRYSMDAMIFRLTSYVKLLSDSMTSPETLGQQMFFCAKTQC